MERDPLDLPTSPTIPPTQPPWPGHLGNRPPSQRPPWPLLAAVAGGIAVVVIVALLLALLFATRSGTTTALLGAAADQTATAASAQATSTVERTPPPSATGTAAPHATATPRPSGPAVHIVSAQGIVNSTSTGVDALCPTGELALSGGWRTDASHPILSSRRRNQDNVSWLVGSYSTSDTPLTAYVLCLQRSAGASITERMATSEIAAGAGGSVAVPCFAGEVPVGGGVAYSPDFDVSHFGLSPDQSGFSLTVVNHNSSSWSATVYVECLKASGAHLTVPAPTQVSISQHGSGSVQISCPKGTLLSGGGIDLLNGVAVAYGFGPSSATTWQAQVQNQTIVSTTGKLYALCLSFS
jgi:hypothetical protein